MNNPIRSRWSLGLIFLATLLVDMASASSASNGIIIRIRLGDGSMEKVQVPTGAEESMTVSEILGPFSVPDGSSIQAGNSKVEDATSSTLAGLGLKHGSIITITSPTSQKPAESRFSQLVPDSNIWNPFPDLAKDYKQALLKTKTRRSSQKGMSYADIARLQSSLHTVDPQPEGPLKRVYMCKHSAERFQSNGILAKQKGIQVRVGLLLGTIQTERVQKTPKKARTSLSSQVSDTDYCTVAKVQAVWEPPGQKPTNMVYDTDMGAALLESNPRVLEIANHLGLVPVGWIFSYQDNRHEDDDALPIHGADVQTGASLQITNMKSLGRSEGAKFVTLAMDANSGATEAFQLSDVSVQMVAEGLLVPDDKNGRQVPTKHAVLVDGKEVKKLDSVLFLVNTAMLPHVGTYSGKSATSAVKKNGNLLIKTKKALLAAVDSDASLLEELSDFNTLLALDQALSKADSEELCQLVRKWVRGQKRGTLVTPKLKMQLRSILET
jgi:hypothetical protein